MFFFNKNSKKSLFKIFFSFNLIVFLLILIVAAFILYKISYMSNNRLILNSMSYTSNSIIKSIEKENSLRDLSFLKDKIGLFSEYICIISMDGKIIFEEGKTTAQINQKQILTDKEISKGKSNTFKQQDVFPEVLVLCSPIKLKGAPEVILLIASSTKQSTIFTIGNVIITLVLILCGYIIYTLLCQWYFYARIIKPLNEIISVTQIFSYGLSTNKLDIRSSFEFEKLSKSFNAMFDQIKQHIDDLKLHTRLATIGEITSELAHELKNKLGSSVFAIKQIAESGRLNSSDKEMAEDIVLQLEDLIESCKEFLDFAKPYDLNFVPINLNELINKVIKNNSAYFLKHEVIIKKSFNENLPNLNIDPKRISEVLEILIHNSVQAMTDNKTIEITTFNSNHKVGFSVKDFGKGMDDYAVEMAMEPFFTTKETGTGLGLSIAFKIVKEHKAFIDIQSQPFKGTEITVMFD